MKKRRRIRKRWIVLAAFLAGVSLVFIFGVDVVRHYDVPENTCLLIIMDPGYLMEINTEKQMTVTAGNIYFTDDDRYAVRIMAERKTVRLSDQEYDRIMDFAGSINWDHIFFPVATHIYDDWDTVAVMYQGENYWIVRDYEAFYEFFESIFPPKKVSYGSIEEEEHQDWLEKEFVFYREKFGDYGGFLTLVDMVGEYSPVPIITTDLQMRKRFRLAEINFEEKEMWLFVTSNTYF